MADRLDWENGEGAEDAMNAEVAMNGEDAMNAMNGRASLEEIPLPDVNLGPPSMGSRWKSEKEIPDQIYFRAVEALQGTRSR